MIPFGFDEPLWLLALLVVPVIVLAARGSTALVRPRQHRAATWLRAVGVGALILALAGPRWLGAGEHVDVAFLVDGSDSVAGSQSRASTWIAEALGAKGDRDRVAIARFGADARLEHTLREDVDAPELRTIVDGSATDISRGLRLAQGVLGAEQRRRVVLLSDGLATSGDALDAARQLAEAGIAVDVVPLEVGREADVMVESVDAPNRVRQGESFDVTGVLRNTGDAPTDVEVVVSADGAEVHREVVTAAPGRTEVAIRQTAEGSGTVRYELRLASGASSIPENDVGRTAVAVDGPPKVLVFEGETGTGFDLARALQAGGVPTDQVSAELRGFPSLDQLLDYESVVLVDVPVPALGTAGLQALDAFVRDAGRGLVAVGGDDSFGMGGYDDTPLEDLLPVFARVKDPKRRPSVAEALVVDVSGSMAACHCRGEGFAGGGEAVEGGVNKTDITKAAIARAVEALEQQDLVGVLAFNAAAEWVIPLQQLPPESVVDEALSRLRPDGPTNVVPAIREAIAGLKDTNARLRHIVLFTDGFSEDPSMVQVAREAAEAGITLSVVGTGEGAGDVLRDMAEAGGGRYYPGRDLFSIPDIIVSEIQFAARPVINEGRFLPTVTGVDAPTEQLDTAPPLYGYLATTAKPTARQLLQIGEERDPLLASWQVGLGRSVAWTSDAAPRWSRDWVTWERFTSFWADVVKTTFPGEPNPDFALSAATTAGGIEIEVDSAVPLPAEISGSVTVTFPDGRREEVELRRAGLNRFAASVPGGAEGIYAVSARLSHNGEDVFRDAVTAIRSYSPEYAAGTTDADLLQRIAAEAGGRFDPEPATAFIGEGLEPGRETRALWPLLALLALMTIPADVGLRRLRLERGDLGRAIAVLRRRRERRQEPVETAAGTLVGSARRRRAEAVERDAMSPPASPRPEPDPPVPPATAPAPEPAAESGSPVSTPAEEERPTPGTPADKGGAERLLEARRRRREERDG